MTSVGKLAAAVEAQSRPDSTSPPAQEPQRRVLLPIWASRLQTRLAAIYGHRFTSSFPSEQAAAEWRDTWARALGDLSGEEIARGLDACAKELEWPPSIAEFRGMCRLHSRIDPNVRALLAAPRDTKDRSAELASIKAMLAKRMTRHA